MPPQIAKAEEPSLCVSLLQCMFQSDFVIWEESSYLPFSVKLLWQLSLTSKKSPKLGRNSSAGDFAFIYAVGVTEYL